VPNYGGELSAQGTQRDLAVIDTSTDLSAYGAFALDPTYTSGDVVVNGYPATGRGHQAGMEGVLSQDGALSDIDTSGLSLAPGYSGGPIWDRVERNGAAVPAVVGTVSTSDDAMKLTRAKVALIRHWIASDALLYADGTGPNPVVPQIAGTVASRADSAAVPTPADAATLAAAIITGSATDGPAAAAPSGHPAHGAGWDGPDGRHGAFGSQPGAMWADLAPHPFHHGRGHA
jgi:hypothetical protein